MTNAIISEAVTEIVSKCFQELIPQIPQITKAVSDCYSDCSGKKAKRDAIITLTEQGINKDTVRDLIEIVDRSIERNKDARDKIIESYILHNETGKAERANILSSVTAILSTVAFLGTVGVTGYTLMTDNKTKRRQSSDIRKTVQTMSRERTLSCLQIPFAESAELLSG